jgi:hypothetical protein
MIRNLKALGLALVAVFAMMAMAAQGAQGEEGADFTPASFPTTIDITNESTFTWAVPGLPTQTCAEVSGHAILEDASPELTATEIQFATCHVVTLGITFPVTVDMNGCHYLFTAHTYTPKATEGDGAADGDVHIVCPEDREKTITVFKAGSSGHPEADLRCTIHVPPQTPGPATDVTYLNENTEGKMAITAQFHELEAQMTVTESTICGKERTVTAKFNLSLWMKATDDEGNYIDLTMSGTG